MALAERHLRARLGDELVNHHTYGFVSDGDLMEGISAETSSLAGHFGLGRLIYLYDDNDISIDGSTDITFSEDVNARFGAVGWHTLDIDGHDRDAIDEAIREALSVEDRPSLITCHTHIAHGAPNAQDTAESHGSPLGEEEIQRTKEAMGHLTEPTFYIDDAVYEFFRSAMERGQKEHATWRERLDDASDDQRELWDALHSPPSISLQGPEFEVGGSLATRAAGGKLFGEIAEKVPGFIGGAADLAGSTKTVIDPDRLFSSKDPTARDIPFGVREHAMGTIVNGIALHGGLAPYGATFFVFSDYMRPAVRISALADIRSIWVWTHDSVFLGEDGPTHQPIEHLASMRSMPNIWVIRPGHANEVTPAWEMALNRTDGPVAILFTRQGVRTLEADHEGVKKGGYVIREGDDVTIIATGSEVPLAVDASDVLDEEGISARVVSLPCLEVFQSQDATYKSDVLGSLPRVSLEAASTFGWDAIVGDRGLSIGIDHFGASAPAGDIAEHLGFTAIAVAERVRQHLAQLGS